MATHMRTSKMRRSNTFDAGVLHSALPVATQMHEFKQSFQQQKKIVSVIPAPKQDSLNADDITRKIDIMIREINVTQKLICDRFAKLDQLVIAKSFESKAAAPVMPAPVQEPDKRFDKVRESIMKGRRESFAGIRSFSSVTKGRESALRLPEVIKVNSSESPPRSPPESPRAKDALQEESDSSKEECESDSSRAERRPNATQMRRSVTVGTVGTHNSWRTWTSENVRSATMLSVITGRISARLASIVTSYTQTEQTLSVDKSESVREMVSQRTKQNRVSYLAWNFLDNPDSSWSAKLYDSLEPYFLLLAAVFSLLQTLPNPQSFLLPEFACKIIDFSIDSLIMFDLLVRYAVSPSRGFAFFKKWLNAIDLLVAVALILRISLVAVSPEAFKQPMLLCLVAIARLMKMMRRFQKIHLLVGAFELALEAIPVLTYVLALLTLAFSAAIYVVEPRDNFDTLPRSIYFTLVTVTTLGYGDYSPITTAGQLIVSILTLCSTAYMAMPIGIIGSAFYSVWEDRDRILVMKKTKQAMTTWGFTARDIPMLFSFFDSQGRGTLNLRDFREMVVAMRIGLSDNRVRDLFKSIDKDGSGSIDDKEFIRHIFPTEFFDVFTVSETASSSSGSALLSVPETKSSKASVRSGSPRSSIPVPSSSSSIPPGTPSWLGDYQSEGKSTERYHSK